MLVLYLPEHLNFSCLFKEFKLERHETFFAGKLERLAGKLMAVCLDMLVKKALLVSNHSPMTSDPYFPFYGA
jgi:hypothetical protein